jgi:putative transposase
MLVERDENELPLSVQAELLSLSRSSLYYQPIAPSAEEVALKHRIDAIYTDYPFYGSRRITVQLRREGMIINRKAVQRHMQEMGLAGICPGPNLSQRNLGHRHYLYSPPEGLALLSRYTRLVFTLRRQLATRRHLGYRFRLARGG